MCPPPIAAIRSPTTGTGIGWWRGRRCANRRSAGDPAQSVPSVTTTPPEGVPEAHANKVGQHHDGQRVIPTTISEGAEEEAERDELRGDPTKVERSAARGVPLPHARRRRHTQARSAGRECRQRPPSTRRARGRTHRSSAGPSPVASPDTWANSGGMLMPSGKCARVRSAMRTASARAWNA